MDNSRQQFEETMKNNYNTKGINLDLQREGKAGTYRWRDAQICWEMWQASRESLEVELPYKHQPKFYSYEDGINTGLNMCKDILISNGVKIKNGTL